VTPQIYNNLKLPKMNTNAGKRTFAFLATNERNLLPDSVRCSASFSSFRKNYLTVAFSKLKDNWSDFPCLGLVVYNNLRSYHFNPMYIFLDLVTLYIGIYRLSTRKYMHAETLALLTKHYVFWIWRIESIVVMVTR
jgi:hypothetical protein